ncbi:MAG: hypothetical protein KAS93_08155, partial [Gammaproteobacteria bacterium]|nr:hypothetical protein [Gammaproteobacteria bacterium]
MKDYASEWDEITASSDFGTMSDTDQAELREHYEPRVKDQEWQSIIDDQEYYTMPEADRAELREHYGEERVGRLKTSVDFGGAVGDVWSSLKQTPADMMGSLSSIFDDPYTTTGITDAYREGRKKVQQDFLRQPGAHKRALPFLDVTRGEVREAGQSIPFSAAGMIASTAPRLVGVGTGPLGIAASMAAGGVAAKRMDEHSFVTSYRDFLNSKREEPLTDEEFAEYKTDDFLKAVSEHGTTEGLFEGVANVLELALLGRIKGVNLGQKALKNMAQFTAFELGSEAETAIVQGNIEAGLGLPGREVRDPFSPTDIVSAGKEVLLPTLMLGGVMGGPKIAFEGVSNLLNKAETTEQQRDEDGFLSVDNVLKGDEFRKQAETRLEEVDQRIATADATLEEGFQRVAEELDVTGGLDKMQVAPIAEPMVAPGVTVTPEVAPAPGIDRVDELTTVIEEVATAHGVEKQEVADTVISNNPIYDIVTEIKRRGGLSHDSASVYDVGPIVKRHPGLVSKTGTVNIDEIAGEYGYASEQDFMDALVNSETKQNLRKAAEVAPTPDTLGAEFKSQSDRIAREEGINIERTGEMTPVTAGDLNVGDKVVINDADGIPRVVQHAGYDGQGNVEFTGDMNFTSDVFETLDTYRVKRGMRGEPTEIQGDLETIAAEDRAEVLQAAKERISETEDKKIAPYREILTGAIDRRLGELQEPGVAPVDIRPTRGVALADVVAPGPEEITTQEGVSEQERQELEARQAAAEAEEVIPERAEVVEEEVGEGEPFADVKLSVSEPEGIKSIKKDAKKQGVNLGIYEQPNEIHIQTIIVPKEIRRQGIGSEVMSQVVEYADSVGKLLTVTPAEKDDFHGTTSKARLKRFYKRFGFVENKGRNKDFSINARDMYREPVAGAKLSTTAVILPTGQQADIKQEIGRASTRTLVRKNLLEIITPKAATDILSRVTGGKFSYAGIKSLTADLPLQEQAEQRVDAGEDPELVRQDTGWFMAKDRMWRYEIDDSQAKFAPVNSLKEVDGVYAGTLGDLLDHQELYDAYPESRNVKVILNPGKSKSGGRASFTTKPVPTIEVYEVSGDTITDGQESSIIHEIQHNIQEIEGFAKGGSILAELKRHQKAAKSVDDQVERFDKMLEATQGTDEYDTIMNAKLDFVEHAEQEGLTDPEQILENAHRDYQRILGEVEARDVAERKGFTKEQRRAFPPYISQGISEKDLVVRYSEDGSRVEGFTVDGKVYMIQGNIAKGQANPVLSHELGVHAKQLGFQETDTFKGILETLRNRRGSDTKQGRAIQEAYDRVPEDTRPEHVDEEVLAYLVSNSPEIGIVRRFIADLKKFMIEKMGIPERVLNTLDMQALALSVVQREARDATGREFRTVEEMADIKKSVALADDVVAPRSKFTGIGSKLQNTIGQHLTPDVKDRIATYLYDRLQPVKRIQRRATRSLQDQEDYLLHRRVQGRKIADELRRAKENEIAPVQKKFADSDLDYSNAEEFMWAEHAPERNLQMKRVRAMGFIKNTMKFMTEKERSEFEDLIIDAKNDVDLMPVELEKKRDNYVDIMDSMADKVAAWSDTVSERRSKLDSRIFTQAEHDKGTPGRLQKQFENAERRLEARKDIVERWDDVKDRLSGMTNEESEDIIKRWREDERYEALLEISGDLRNLSDKALK